MSRLRTIAAVAAVTITALSFGVPRASATHQPADKIAVSGSALEVMTAPLTEGAASETASLMSATLRTSGPTDLILAVTAECALWTNITNVGNSESEAVAQVKVWIEIDGQPVAVSADDAGPEQGKVVFCDRAYRRVISDLDDEDATFQNFLRTRTANAFNWITVNVGSGVHDIEVLARLDTSVTGVGMAQAAVGKRTLVVTPAKLANDATI